jgi:hypothetical protein
MSEHVLEGIVGRSAVDMGGIYAARAAWADFLTETATISSSTHAPCQSSLPGQLPVQPDNRLLDRCPRQVQVTTGVLDQGLVCRAERVEERPAGVGLDQVVVDWR